MKIKPRIKTHWLASQNPLMISLGGIKSVVFYTNASLVDFGFGLDANTNSIEKSISPASFRRSVKNPLPSGQAFGAEKKKSLDDLFWNIFSGNEFTGVNSSNLILKKLAASIEFIDEKGEAISLVGAFRLPDLPLFLNPHFYLDDRSCNWERVLDDGAETLMSPLKILPHQKNQNDFRKTWIVVLEILAWSLQRQRQVGDLSVFWSEGQTELEGLAYPLSEIEFKPSRPVVASVTSSSRGVLSIANVRFWQGFSAVETPSVVHFFANDSEIVSRSLSAKKNFSADFLDGGDSGETLKVELEELKKQIVKQKKKPVQELEWRHLFETSWVGSSVIQEGIEKLRSIVTDQQIFYIDCHTITAQDFKPFLKARESEGLVQVAVGFKLSGHDDLSLLNLPNSMTRFMKIFFFGMDVFFNIERKDYASQKNQYRQNDLLLLRHQGLIVFCGLELINWILGLPLTSGHSIEHDLDNESAAYDRQFAAFISYLKSSIPGLLGRAQEDFDLLFSPKAKEFFLDFVEKCASWLENDHSLGFFRKKIFKFRNVQKSVLPLLRFCLLYLAEQTEGKVLTRAQSKFGDRFLQQWQNWSRPEISQLSMAANLNEGLNDEGLLWLDLGFNSKYLIHLLFELLDQGVEIEWNGLPFLSKENPFEFVLNISDGKGNSDDSKDTNWFDLHPQVFFDGVPVDAEQVKLNFTPNQIGFIEYQGQIYRIDKKQIPSLKSLQKFWQRLNGVKNFIERANLGDRVYRLQKSMALHLLMLRSQGLMVNAEGEWSKLFQYFDQGLGQEKIVLPTSCETMLLPHQREGAQWLYDLYQLKLGAILADEMGLGKTFQVLAFLESLRLKNSLGLNLIVVPTSLVYNWLEERKKFAPDLPVEIFRSTDKERIADRVNQNPSLVMITTYGLLLENTDFFSKIMWNVAVFDEAQNLKNITSMRSVSARRLQAQFKLCLTGTPMENNYLEFYSLCDLVVPGCLGEVEDFRKSYLSDEVRVEAVRELRQVTKPLLLRRTKQQVQLNLPVKTIHQVLLPFGEAQKDIYKKMAMSYSRQVDDLIQQNGEKKAQIAMFAALMRLRQICSDPAAVPGVVFKEQPVKVQHFLASLQEHLEEGESVIVFTQFLSTLSRIEAELKKANIEVYTLQGRVLAQERVRLIQAFNQSEKPGVMLMTLKTGGVGLNLTKASVVYHLEPWWNPAVENQATDRAHRMGQTKAVKVFNLLIEGSLEERISELKIKKQGAFDQLFSSDEQVENSPEAGASTGLTRDDFLFLLKT